MAISLGATNYQWYGTNASSFTLAGHGAGAGSNRLVMVCGLFQRNAATDYTVGLAFGGNAMTSAVERTGTMTSRWYRAGIWYRLLGNSESGESGDVVATPSVTMAGCILCAITLFGVDQATPVWMTADSNAIPSSLGLGYSPGGPNGPFGFWAAMASAGGTYTWSASSSEISPTEVFDLGPASSDSAEMAGGGYRYIWPDGTDNVTTVTISRGSTPTAQVGVGVKFKPAAVSAVAAGRLVNAPRLKSKLRGLV